MVLPRVANKETRALPRPSFFQAAGKTADIQTEGAYQKQPSPRYYKSIGLGFKMPKEAIEGIYIDKKCPFTDNISILGRILSGVVTQRKMQRTIVIRQDDLNYIGEYIRFEKHHKNMSVFRDVQICDIVNCGRVPAPEQDCVLQRAQGRQGCRHQEAVPEVPPAS
ncbi:small ribosomal subunit protein uS17-like [Tenrec ecaudatus]|uniref:small ribosomal subunit protein uS17-like n=1 Tax=Tenrec ecaudatus TaxID=94439 RepID=UPI003F5AD905